MLRISFDFGHPAHYLMFRNVLSKNEALGFKPVIFIQEKDVLMNLLKENGHNFYIRRNKNTTLSRLSLLPRDILYTRKIMKEKNVFVNFSKCFPLGSIAARSLSRRSIQFDDTEPARGQIFLFRYTANEIWTPDCYMLDFGSKHKRIKGLLQLAYLHPTVFKPDKSIPESYGLLERGKPIIIRIIDYQAAHDWKYRSFKDNYENMMKELAKEYDIILSIEGDYYPKKWNRYILKIKPPDYHHILAFSKLYIGSGASSAAEAAILGVPSIYTNFETRGFIDLLENKYNIIKTIKPKNLNINNIKNLLEINKSIWNNIKNKIIKNCIDVPKFIENLVKREIKLYYDQ